MKLSYAGVMGKFSHNPRLLLCGILILGAVLRLVKFNTSFYGTTGEWFRDLLVARSFLVEGQVPLLGPSSSLGSFNFGAVYYYLITPFVWLFGFAPYGAIFVSVLFSLLSIGVLYQLIKLWFCRQDVALLGSFLLSVSLFDIQNAYYISNPNLLPFFMLWFFYCLTKILQGSRGWKELAGLGVSFGVASQLHFTAMLLLAIVGLGAILVKRIKISLSEITPFLIMVLACYSPYIIYETTHNFSNTRTLVNMGSSSIGTGSYFSVAEGLLNFWNSAFILKNDFFNIYAINLGLSLVFIGLLAAILVLWRLQKKRLLDHKLVSPTKDAKILMQLWGLGGGLMFFLFNIRPQFFYFLCLWPLPLVLLAWLMIYFKDNRVFLYRYFLVLVILMQAIQLYYFYNIVNRRAYEHNDVAAAYGLVGKNYEKDKTSFQVINVYSSPHEHAYYLDYSGLSGIISRTEASNLYFVRDPKAFSENPVFADPEKYSEVDRHYFGGLELWRYEKK